MNALTPLAMVIDRATAPSVADGVRECGGAWAEMFDVWYESSSPYLVMIAHTKKRLRLRAPLTYIVVNEHGLRTTMQHACRLLDHMKCRWCLFVEKQSQAEQVVRAELLTDTVVEGHS